MVFAAAVAVFILLCFAWRAWTPARGDKDSPTPLWQDSVFREALSRSGARGIGGIAIVAPSSGLSVESAKTAYEMAVGLGVRFSPQALDVAAVPYTANSDEVRLELLRQAFEDEETEVLWALRGGYGSSRLLAEFDPTLPPEKRKIFIGYSDLTFVHLLMQKWNRPSVHGAMFWELKGAGKGKSEENFRALARLLTGEEKELRYDGIKPFNRAAERLDTPIRAVVRGGNLACLAAAVGTPWSVDAAGCILFLEDVDEKGYQLDRMLTQLKEAGVLDKVGAVLLGEFVGDGKGIGFALERFARDIDVPVFRCELFGHGATNLPLVFNSPAVMEKSDRPDGAFSLVISTEPLFQR